MHWNRQSENNHAKWLLISASSLCRMHSVKDNEQALAIMGVIWIRRADVECSCVLIIEDNGGTVGSVALEAHWNHSLHLFRFMIFPVRRWTVAWNSLRRRRQEGWVQWNQRTTSRWTAQTDNWSRRCRTIWQWTLEARLVRMQGMDGIQLWWWHWGRFESEWPQDNTRLSIKGDKTDAWRKRRTWHGVPVHDAISDMRTLTFSPRLNRG